MKRIRGLLLVRSALLALSCGFGLTSTAAVAQVPPPKGDQCAVNQTQIELCRGAVERCVVDVRQLLELRNRARSEAAALRERSCGPDTEPRWREIVRHLIAQRLDPLKREPPPGSKACERFTYQVAGNARVVLEGRVNDAAIMRQRVREQLRLAVPGIEIEIDDSRLVATGECLVTIDPEGSWGRDGDAPRSRTALTPDKMSRMPPDTECPRLGARLDADRTLDQTMRRKQEDGFWVLDGGLLSLCRKNPMGGGWEVTRTNILPETEGITILREIPQ